MCRVLLLCEYATLNGGEQSMLSTLGGLRDAGIKPSVVGPPAGPLADALHGRDVDVIPFPSHDAAGKRHSQGQLRERLEQILRRHDPDLLHANSLSMGRLCGPVAKSLRLPSLDYC